MTAGETAKNNMPLTEINPIKAALEYLRRAQYAEAANLLRCEFDKSPRTREHIARIANLISPCGMISEAIDALNRMDSSLEEYKANPPADEPIGCTAKQHNQFPKGRWQMAA